MDKIITIGLGFLSQIFIVKYFLIKTIRLKSHHTKKIYDQINNSKGIKFLIKDSLIEKDNESPVEFSGFFKLKKHPPFYISFEERLLTTGYQSKESVGYLTFFRWDIKKIKEFFKPKEFQEETHFKIFIQEGYSTNYLGQVNKEDDIKIRPIASDLEKDIILMNEGVINKTSCLSYGPPGNGKTTLIRDLAKKYGYNIYFINFSHNLRNSEILAGLSYIPERSFVVFEDFDSVFDKRKSLSFEKPSYSFDVILNSLDGIYNNYKQIAFFITANDISKIDDSIKTRTSRMKWILNFVDPTLEEIKEIITDNEISKKCVGLSLDNIYFVEEHLRNKGKQSTLDWLDNRLNERYFDEVEKERQEFILEKNDPKKKNKDKEEQLTEN